MLYFAQGRKPRNVITTAASPLKPNQRLYIFDSKVDETKSKLSTLKGLPITTTEDKITCNGSAFHANSKTLKSTSQTDDKSNSINPNILWPAPIAGKSDNNGIQYADDPKGLQNIHKHYYYINLEIHA